MTCAHCTTGIDSTVICQKIREIYPDIGRCGIEVSAQYDDQAKAWAVTLSKEGHTLKTFLDEEDIRACQEGRECIHLGTQIEQLKKNLGLT
ncbi:hypothetical protein [Thermodesulforhabdus norvegica]|uniref:Uncharacterized protein n=1 Tax=Thermodesulforhabdus norvegica TaxID=39841 RepID=A0A1I4S336_9BACT|nr:hypothetical protein [Thermodesulforhabdus norvegica]SFM58811.1 hypothetical protein SAMN05660836_00719 [Thermodesulforhabdus norvegica]